MIFEEALNVAQVETENTSEDDVKLTIDPINGKLKLFKWKGLVHFTNVASEAMYNSYIRNIETGDLVVGPAMYSVGTKAIVQHDAVGLYLKAPRHGPGL